MDKDDLKQTGIYAIVNLVNGKRYIGSASSSFYQRWKAHRVRLKAKNHHSRRLQRSWDKYGSESFRLDVIEFCDSHECHAREQFYLDFYKCYNPDFGYNICSFVRGRLGVKASDETRRKMSLYSKNRPLAHREAILKGIRSRPPITKEWRQNLRDSHMGYLMPQSQRDKISKSNKGRIVSGDSLKRMIMAQRRPEMIEMHRIKTKHSWRLRKWIIGHLGMKPSQIDWSIS